MNPRFWLYVAAACVLAGALAVLVALSVVGTTTKAAASKPVSYAPVKKAVRGSLGWHEPSQGRKVDTAKAIAAFHYNTNPPTSGPYENLWPTSYVASKPMATGLLVHMEELGNMIIAYAPNTSAATLKQIKAYAASIDTGKAPVKTRVKLGEGVLVTPWPSLKARAIDLLAWTRLDPLTSWQKSQAHDFRVYFLGNKQNTKQ